MTKIFKAKENIQSPRDSLSDALLKRLLQYVTERAHLAKRRGTIRAIVDEIIILLLVGSGLRARELCNLNICDLPLSQHENSILVKNDQGNISRSIKISSELTKTIRMYLSYYREEANLNEPFLVNERG